ncbi:MAG: hypothetical protein JNL96_27180 [Planctomycetaceae bacterium]|nr:hypothetical protein [Planctomycetaceae bacterium]
MHSFSPQAINVCLIVLQVLGLAGVWLMRVGERTQLAHSLRGLFILVMLLLAIVTTVSLVVEPRSGLISGVVLAVMAVLAVVDLRPVRKR